MAAQGIIFCTNNTGFLTQAHQTFRLWGGSCLTAHNGASCQIPQDVQEHLRFPLSAHFLAVQLQHFWHNNSCLQFKTHRRKTENFALLSFLSHKLPLMSSNKRHSPPACTGTTCSTAHTDLTSIDQGFRNHLPPAWERLKSPAKSLYLQDKSSHPIPTSHISYPFPTKLLAWTAKGDLLLGSAVGPVSPPSFGAQLECACVHQRAAGDNVPGRQGPHAGSTRRSPEEQVPCHHLLAPHTRPRPAFRPAAGRVFTLATLLCGRVISLSGVSVRKINYQSSSLAFSPTHHRTLKTNAKKINFHRLGFRELGSF